MSLVRCAPTTPPIHQSHNITLSSHTASRRLITQLAFAWVIMLRKKTPLTMPTTSTTPSRKTDASSSQGPRHLAVRAISTQTTRNAAVASDGGNPASRALGNRHYFSHRMEKAKVCGVPKIGDRDVGLGCWRMRFRRCGGSAACSRWWGDDGVMRLIGAKRYDLWGF